MAKLLKKLTHNDGGATFVRQKQFTEGTLRYSLYKQTQDSIQSGEDPKNSVKLQENVSFEDWLAVHVVDFMNRVQLFYSLVDENCTEDSCPKMSGGQKYEYLWQDGIKYKKPSHLPARDYITTLFEWIEHQIYDETLFPRDESVEFPKNFKKTCVKILGRMYRVFVHVYIHHFDRIKQLDHLNAEAHGNTLFKHFYYFVMEFQLLDEKELEPLEELIKKICI